MRKPELVGFDVHGTEIAVRPAGDPEQPALLRIHGFPSSSTSFRNVTGALARDCYVIAPDLPRFGASDPVGEALFSRFAERIDELLARFGEIAI